MTKVSVLIAVYNASAFLEKCLNSLKGQTLKECQFLCIDDCSSDSSCDIIKKYSEKDSRFKLLHTPVNSGQAVARNVGLQYAEGEYITMLDADDWLGADALEKAYNDIKNTPECDCSVFHLVMHEDSDNSERPYPIKNCKQIMTGEEAFQLSLDWSLHGYYLISRDIHIKYPYDDSYRLYSDDNTTRIHFLHSRHVVLSEGEYFYRQHSASMTHKYTPLRFMFMDAFSSMKKQIEDEIAANNISNPEDTLNRFETLRWFNLMSMFRYYYEHRNAMDNNERKDIKKRLATKLNTIETKCIPWKHKMKFGYYPIHNFTIYSIIFDIYNSLFELKRRLKKLTVSSNHNA